MIAVTFVRLGDHYWTEQTMKGEVDDETRILAGLSVGWSLNGTLYPAQPQPMTATLSVNLPAFTDGSDLLEGDVAAIEIYLADDDWVGPAPAGLPLLPMVSFYGRITDLKAKPRSLNGSDPAAVARPGVTLDVVAVDYTVDVAEAPPYPVSDGSASVDAWSVLDTLWSHACGGSLHSTGLWWGGTEAGSAIWPQTGWINSRAVIDQILLEEIDVPGSQRMIMAPLVPNSLRDYAAGVPLVGGVGPGELHAGRAFTLDTVGVPGDGVDEVVAASVIRRDIGWTQVKGDDPNVATVSYQYAGATETLNVYATGAVAPFTFQPITLDIEDDVTGTVAAQVGAFYVGDPVNDDDWQIDAVTILPHLISGPDLIFPVLFPHWELDERPAAESVARAACYSRRIEITGIRPDLVPFTETAIRGVLFGASVVIENGKPAVTLTLRRMRHSTGWVLGDPIDSVLGTTTVLT